MVDLHSAGPGSFANAEPVILEKRCHADTLETVMESLHYQDNRHIFVTPMGAKLAIFM